MSAVYVYRAFDASGGCLYVGCTGRPARRFAEHRTNSPWAPGVARIQLTVHTSRDAALAVERVEIERLRPTWNVQGRWADHHTWTDQEFVDYIAARRRRSGHTTWTRRHLRHVARVRRQHAEARSRAGAA